MTLEIGPLLKDVLVLGLYVYVFIGTLGLLFGLFSVNRVSRR